MPMTRAALPFQALSESGECDQSLITVRDAIEVREHLISGYPALTTALVVGAALRRVEGHALQNCFSGKQPCTSRDVRRGESIRPRFGRDRSLPQNCGVRAAIGPQCP